MNVYWLKPDLMLRIAKEGSENKKGREPQLCPASEGTAKHP